MALLWTDSFDDRQASTGGALDSILGLRYDDHNAAGYAGRRTSGRTATAAYLYDSGRWLKNIGTKTTVIIGFACKVAAAASAATFLRVMDSGGVQIYLRCNTDGTVSILRGDGTLLASSSTAQVLSSSAWQYLEFKATIASATGAYELRIDNVVWLSASGVNTQATPISRATGVEVMWSVNGSGSIDVDDYYICDALGGVNDDFLGPVKISCLLPNGATASSQWTPSSGLNWQCVDDATPDDDTSYVSTSSVGAADLYAIGDLSVTGTIVGLSLNTRARKDELFSRQYQTILRHASTDSNLTTSDLGIDYRDDQWPLDTNPVTDVSWTADDVNNLQIGVRLSG